MMTRTIRTIFFDIGNVLVGFEHARIWQQLSTVSPFSAEDIHQHIQTHHLLHLHETGAISSKNLYHHVQDLLHLSPSVSFEQFCQLWGAIFWPQEPILQLANSLRHRYHVMLLSNTNEIHWNYLVQTFPLFRQIDDAILSFQVGAMKPALEIYTAALRRSQAPAEQCVFIDDIPVNIQAARDMGFLGIQYRSAEQVKQALRDLGMHW